MRCIYSCARVCLFFYPCSLSVFVRVFINTRPQALSPMADHISLIKYRCCRPRRNKTMCIAYIVRVRWNNIYVQQKLLNIWIHRLVQKVSRQIFVINA